MVQPEDRLHESVRQVIRMRLGVVAGQCKEAQIWLVSWEISCLKVCTLVLPHTQIQLNEIYKLIIYHAQHALAKIDRLSRAAGFSKNRSSLARTARFSKNRSPLARSERALAKIDRLSRAQRALAKIDRLSRAARFSKNRSSLARAHRRAPSHRPCAICTGN